MGYSLLPKKAGRRTAMSGLGRVGVPARAGRGMGDLLTYGRDTARFTRGVGAIAAADAVMTPKRKRQLVAQARADIRRDHALSQITLNGLTTPRNEGGGAGGGGTSGGTTSWGGATGRPTPGRIPGTGTVRPGTITPTWGKYPGIPTPSGAARPIGKPPLAVKIPPRQPIRPPIRVQIGTKVPSRAFPMLPQPMPPITGYKPRPSSRPPGGGVGPGVPSSGGGGSYTPPVATIPPPTPTEIEEFEELDVPIDVPAAATTEAPAAAKAGGTIGTRGMLAIAAAGIGLFFLFR